MTRHTLYHEDPKKIRNSLAKSQELSFQIHKLEQELIILLAEIDQKRFYVRLGFYSLRNYCQYWLNFTRTQSQRITTLARRSQTMDHFGQKPHSQ